MGLGHEERNKNKVLSIKENGRKRFVDKIRLLMVLL